MQWIIWVWVVGSLLVAIGRFLVPGHELSLPGIYEALAHIFAGMLLLSSIQQGLLTKSDGNGFWRGFFLSDEAICLWLLTALEIVMFLIR